MKDFEFPFALDKVTGKSSATLFFAYVAFMVALLATGYLVYKDAIAGATSALMLFFGCLVLYKMRHLDKMKFDIEKRSLELEDIPDDKPTV